MSLFSGSLTELKICVFFLHPFFECVESVWESLNSDFRLSHFCLPWPYMLSYRNLIVTGAFRTVRSFCRTQKLCWNMKNKGSFDVANTKIPIIVPFFKNPKFCLVKSWNFEKILVSARRPQNSGSETALYIPLLLPI